MSGESLRILDRKLLKNSTDLLGCGLYSKTFKGTYLDKPCAYKTYLGTQSDIDDHGFTREVITLSKLKHENIITILGYFVPPQNSLNQSLILVMELAQLDLSKIIYPTIEGESQKLIFDDPWKMYTVYVYNYLHVIHWSRQIAVALDFLRKCENIIVHRDLKPENVLMFKKTVNSQDFDFYTCKLTDFNSATFRNNLTQSCKGSHGFMAPELINSSEQRPQDPSLDIYSFGVVVFRMIDRTQDDVESRWFGSNFSQKVKNLVLDCQKSPAESRPTPAAILLTFDQWLKELSEAGECVEFEPVCSYRVKHNCVTDKCFYIMNTEAVPDEQVGECKTSEHHNGLRLTFESVNKELQDKIEMNKVNKDSKAAMESLLDDFGLVEAYNQDKIVKEEVNKHLSAQEEYQKQLALTKNSRNLEQRIKYLVNYPDDLMRALHCKKEEIDRLVERKVKLTEKIVSQYFRTQMEIDEAEEGVPFHSMDANIVVSSELRPVDTEPSPMPGPLLTRF